MTLGTARKAGIRLLSDKNAATGGEPAAFSVSGDFSVSPAVFVPTPTPPLDCDCILSRLLGVPRSYLFSHPETVLTEPQCAAFFDAVRLRRTGLPVAYITGHKEFWALDFLVTRAVLIPKPDTELLVERALETVARIVGANRPAPPAEGDESGDFAAPPCASVRIADVCTGSGCVAVSILHTLPYRADIRYEMYATDISPAALSVARENAKRLLKAPAAYTLDFFEGDLLEPLLSDAVSGKESFDLIVSNPPYVPADVTARLLADGRSEPELALNGDCDGTTDGTGLLRRLIGQARWALKRGGFFLIETGEYNAAAAASYLAKNGFTDIVTYTDLGGMPRVTLAKKL
ncbi:protein-(glutamine-N5) methyltransferase, release factor-specific [Treponema brennaborense DSM 12168]|uniref:peptide chain release factor N(5)-glutamine methyltransferase n=1 Tax=Treponema brennaborense (strain DSM 12168 / CIP 105900 / DD5/3) TaxID=906968 RepID=F4LK67_TREBD|nr:protein-(glutamine-N5) methyltransferase, release factor-specific [Treponema brennaborense DSM 12168]